MTKLFKSIEGVCLKHISFLDSEEQRLEKHERCPARSSPAGHPLPRHASETHVSAMSGPPYS